MKQASHPVIANTFVALLILSIVCSAPLSCPANEAGDKSLTLEAVGGEGIWTSPVPGNNSNPDRPLLVKVWFDHQLLGDGDSYKRRAKEFSSAKRTQLRTQVVKALKEASLQSHRAANKELIALLENHTISELEKHWIINGFTCLSTAEGIKSIKTIPGVKKIFLSPYRNNRADSGDRKPIQHTQVKRLPFKPRLHKHPWYIRSLLAEKTWKEFNITGRGTLNIIHDNNFVFPESLSQNLYFNPGERTGNNTDDDGNGLVDDCHGYNFRLNSPLLTTRSPETLNTSALHGTMCAAIICGRGSNSSPYAFGIAPEGKWAGVIAGNRIESAVEWAIEQKADTYSMSFSIPGLGEIRSHWRKIMEHGSFCGIYFVSGAGNFARSEQLPRQMRTPENIPDAVFAAAGVQRDLSRTDFSSKGPVEWDTEHYHEGKVQKPEVCAFNQGLPLLLPDGTVIPAAISGNSFAGPMFCGAIALMLSADPDLLPWSLKEIITECATDIGPPGIDNETGHGLINCYRSVKEVLRRKALREGNRPAPFTGRSPNDEINPATMRKQLANKQLVFTRLKEGGRSSRAGIKPGDILLSVNGKPIASIPEFQEILRNSRDKNLILLIKRGDKQLEIRLTKGSPGIAGMQERFSAPVFE
ncbi:MAG: S8 family serine peptidase [Verrucomicrobiaceae bacterium]|nr:S8 family serine peptidase [Verrucomicrobiaceae bacterium]